MCKYLQFEDRFYKSLDFLDNQIKKLRIDAAHHIDSLYGDALYKSAIYALSGRFPVKEREVLVERWKKIVVDKTTMDLNDLELNLFEDSEFLSTQFIRISGQITSYFKSGIIFNDPNCVSELIVDFANKNAAGVFDQQICKVEVVDGALDIQLQELSSKIDCNIPIFMKNISNLYENYYELARFRSLRKSNLYLSTKSSSSTNLQERIKDFIFVDLTLDRHTLSAFFLDIIIYASEPPFLKYKNQISK